MTVEVCGPYRDEFLLWCAEENRRPDRAALRDWMGWAFPVRYQEPPSSREAARRAATA